MQRTAERHRWRRAGWANGLAGMFDALLTCVCSRVEHLTVFVHFISVVAIVQRFPVYVNVNFFVCNTTRFLWRGVLRVPCSR